jgi:hypothetical protein
MIIGQLAGDPNDFIVFSVVRLASVYRKANEALPI